MFKSNLFDLFEGSILQNTLFFHLSTAALSSIEPYDAKVLWFWANNHAGAGSSAFNAVYWILKLNAALKKAFSILSKSYQLLCFDTVYEPTAATKIEDASWKTSMFILYRFNWEWLLHNCILNTQKISLFYKWFLQNLKLVIPCCVFQ